MKISNDLFGKLIGNNSKILELKRNEIYSANIKERLSDNQAVVQIRGKELKVKFEGSMPKDNRTYIQVTNKGANNIFVKSVDVNEAQNEKDYDIGNIISKLGMKSTPELKRAAKALSSNGIPITKENLKNLDTFISKGEGSVQEKMATIEKMAQKGIEFTPTNLEAVHETLHGDGIHKALDDIGNSVESRDVSEILEGSYRENLSEEELIRDAIKEVRELLAKGEDLDKILEVMKEGIKDKDISLQLEKAIQATKAFEIMGHKEEGINRLLEVLDGIEGGLLNNKLDNSLNTSAYAPDKDMPSPTSKAFVMEKVSEKMVHLTEKFTDLKRQVIRNIDNVTGIVRNSNSNTYSSVKGILDKSIELIDKAILKSDITLYADMQTERDLMGLSSKLSQAKRFLSKGQTGEAMKLFNEVKDKLSKLNFKPSETKIIHGATKESMFPTKGVAQKGLQTSLSSLSNEVANSIASFNNQPPSARGILELLRALGLNYESEVAQQLVGNLDEELQNKDIQKNLKAILLRAMENQENGSKDSLNNQSIVKAINNLTGQQLLSKQDSNPHQQNMFFNIPLKMHGELGNVKLFVNGRKENEKIDWENTSLYFLIDGKKMGPTGIQISSTDRNLSVTIKNDKKGLKDKIGALSNNLKDKLEDIGYNVIGVNFTSLNNEMKAVTPKESRKNAMVIPDRINQKGFDLKI